MPDLHRHTVTLYDAKGAVVHSADFAHEDEARIYQENAEALAKEIGGRVESTVEEADNVAG